MKETANNENDLSHNGASKGEEIAPPARGQFRSVMTTQHTTVQTPTFQISNQETFIKNSKAIESNVSRSCWDIQKPRSKPPYPLVREVEVPDSIQGVANKLCDFLRLRSVTATYKNCEAYCKTGEYLKYVIHLYEGSTKDCCIVEVLRLSGCGFSFRSERMAVIDAAQGKNTNEKPKPVLKLPGGLIYQPPSRGDHENTLERATDRLHSQNRDEKLFILQNLSSITSPEKVNLAAATQLAQLILEDYSDIRRILVAFLKAIKPEADDIACQSQNACLSIFSNCFTIIASQEKNHRALLSDSSDMVDDLIEIVDKCYCPHNTTIALRCLSLLVKCSPDAQCKVSEEFRRTVLNAKVIGHQRHYKLEQEAMSALDVLQC